ncbi:MAG: energy-coupled thiamine transporter ThiT, partial [Eubacteriales bacterium]|nr:energy-coupled thiamine transporter ThiT [Eubacteriales bacterium]
MNQTSKTKKLTTSSLMVAISVVLVLISKAIPSVWLQGGSITLASAVPIIAVSLLYGWGWGISAGLAFSLIQMMTGFYPPPTQTVWNFILVVMLDYILAFGVIGMAGIIYKGLGKRAFAMPLSAFIVTTLRYVCHILSGVIIWGVYAEEGQSVLAYSIIYNGTYMIPEII